MILPKPITIGPHKSWVMTWANFDFDHWTNWDWRNRAGTWKKVALNNHWLTLWYCSGCCNSRWPWNSPQGQKSAAAAECFQRWLTLTSVTHRKKPPLFTLEEQKTDCFSGQIKQCAHFEWILPSNTKAIWDLLANIVIVPYCPRKFATEHRQLGVSWRQLRSGDDSLSTIWHANYLSATAFDSCWCCWLMA